MGRISREHIIAEIRRTAAPSGHPLGRLRFEKETGIRESDWLGRYWSRWSDAVREAGFEPNKMQEPVPLESLVESLAELTSRLGHFPTVADLKLASRDGSFPSHNTFGRLGSRGQRALRVLEHCEARGGLEDVAAICRPIAGADVVPAPEVSDKPDVFGYVYLMKSGKFYKIGRSVCAEKRAYEVRLVLPEELVLVHKIKTDDPVGIEAYWHQRFAERRLRGEWFDLSPHDVKAFRRRKYM